MRPSEVAGERALSRICRAIRESGPAVGLLLLALIVFRPLLHRDAILFCSDDNIGYRAKLKAAMPDIFVRGWDDQTFLGSYAPVQPGWTPFLLWILPLRWHHNWMHAVDLLLASLLLMRFLRNRGLRPWASWMGAVAAFWLGSNFTLIYAGHLGKFGVLLMATVALWATERAIARPTGWVAWSILAGSSWGGMFVEQADIALFFAASVGWFVPWSVLRFHGRNTRRILAMLALFALPAALVAFHPLWSGYKLAVENVALVSEDPQRRWAFVTQWSWPPEETIDFVAPGFMGWRTGEPAGPYWGRMGRSPEWEEHRTGFRNFKLENQYLGAIPLILACFAWLCAWDARRAQRCGEAIPGVDGTHRGVSHHSEVMLWFGVAAGTFILALGKFTPVYRVVMLLPGFSAVRAPVKWLQPFQLAVAILAAHGWQRYLETWEQDGITRWGSALKKAVGVAGFLALALIVLYGLLPAFQHYWQSSWPQSAAAMGATARRALLHGFLMAAAAAFLFAAPTVSRLRSWPSRARAFSTAAAALILAADVVQLAPHYVQTLPPSLVQPNEVTEWLQSVQGRDRISLALQEGPYGAWLTFLFPATGIRVLNFTQMPRMLIPVSRFLEAVGRRPDLYWALSGVTRVIMPVPWWHQLRRLPEWADRFELERLFRFIPAGDSGFTAGWTNEGAEDSQAILALRPHWPRFRLATQWQAVPDDEVLTVIASHDSPPADRVYVSPDCAWRAPERRAGDCEIEVVESRPGRHVVRVKCDEPVVLRVADQWHPFWRASLGSSDRREAIGTSVARVDYLFMGVWVPAGEHEVTLEFSPPRYPLAVTLSGWALGALAALVAAWQGLGCRSRTGPTPVGTSP